MQPRPIAETSNSPTRRLSIVPPAACRWVREERSVRCRVKAVRTTRPNLCRGSQRPGPRGPTHGQAGREDRIMTRTITSLIAAALALMLTVFADAAAGRTLDG